MKGSDKAFVGFAVILVVAIGVFAVLLGVATQRRDTARAQLALPESMAIHQELIAKHGTLEPEAVPVDLGAASTDPRARIAAFDALFKETAFSNNDPAWSEVFRRFDWYESWTDEDWASLRALVESLAPQLDRIRALSSKDGPVFALDFSKGHAMVLPHLSPMRHLARLLAAEAILASRDGDLDRVVENVEAMIGLGNGLVGEPVLISQLVRIAMGNITFNTLRALPESGLDPAHYQRIIEVLADADYREAFASSYGGEAAMIQILFDNPELANDLTSSSNVIEYGLVRLYTSPLAAPVRFSDEAAALEVMREIQDAAVLPLYEARPVLERIDARVNNFSWLQPISANVLPSLTHAMEAQARHEATLDIAQLGLAVEQFRDATGSLPASLEEVAGNLGGHLPVDPFTGAAYIYRVMGDGFLVYSVGRDLDDDGGVHDPNRADIVWRGIEPER